MSTLSFKLKEFNSLREVTLDCVEEAWSEVIEALTGHVGLVKLALRCHGGHCFRILRC